MEDTSLMPDVLFRIENKIYSLPATHIQTIVQMPSITAIPNSPNSVRGMIQYRNSIYKLIDLRKLLGLATVQETIDDFNNLMDARLEDHQNWLNELELSVKENRKFKLTTDPHKCKFGIWYDNYKTDNYLLGEILAKFDEPHKRIHQIAEKVEKYKESGDFDSAKNLIESTRSGDLSTMVSLFANIKIIYENSLKELSIIIEDGSTKCAIAVDSVVSVEKLAEADKENSSKNYAGFLDSQFIDKIAERNSGEFVISLNEKNITNT